MKKILMITYDFPPARTSGIYRPVKFVKHLRAFGWEPIVLTVKNPGVLAHDDTLLKDIPSGVKVIRTLTIDLFQLTKKFHDLLYRRKPVRDVSKAPAREDVRTNRAQPISATQKKGWLKRYFFSPLNVFVERWLFIPDQMIGWFPFAFFAALRIMITEKPDVVFSTSTPQTSHLVGIFLKILFRKPWIVDLRDNWFVGQENFRKKSPRGRLDYWLFKQFLKRGDQVVTMCEGNAADLIEEFSVQNPSKYQAITNGFDRDDFVGSSENDGNRQTGKLLMLHMGTLYGGTTGAFFEALAELYMEDSQVEKELEVLFIGYVGGQYAQLIDHLGLRDKVKTPGFKPHPEAIRAMSDADVLLMFLGDRKVTNQQFPGKFFEYVNSERFILALGKRGEIATALERSHCGVLVPHNDAKVIKDTIKDLVKRKRANQISVTPDREFIARYEYRNLTSELVKVLEKAINKQDASMA